jgi:hypothetical protein
MGKCNLDLVAVQDEFMSLKQIYQRFYAGTNDFKKGNKLEWTLIKEACMSTGCSFGDGSKRPRREDDHSHPSSV